jgi:hypothetical protein
MLYQIENTSVRVLGSFHRVPKGKTDWIPYVRPIFDWAEVVHIEMRGVNSQRFSTVPARLGADALPNDLRQKMAQVWPRSLRPMLDCSAVFAYFVVHNVGMVLSDGVEPFIEKWAGQEKPILELETPEEFVGAFDSVSVDVFSDDLSRRIVRTPQARKLLDQLYKAWRARDTARLAQLLDESVPPKLWEVMFVGRNKSWAATVANAAKSTEKTLVVCGCGHLCGPGNLIDELQSSFGLRCIEVKPA